MMPSKHLGNRRSKIVIKKFSELSSLETMAPRLGHYMASDVASSGSYSFWRVKLNSLSVDRMGVLPESDGISQNLVLSTVVACKDGFCL